MFDVKTYMESLIDGLKGQFGERLLYVGLQGSYLRGEATENSDLDVVVVLDSLTTADLESYRELVNSLPQPEKACGFICGREELANWNPLEICSLLHATRDHYGELASCVPEYTRADVVNFVKLGVGNLYHELCHRFLHADGEKNRRKLPGTYKGVFFLLQSVYYLRDGIFYPTKEALLPQLRKEDRAVMDMAIRLAREETWDFREAFELLLCWCKRILVETK